MRTEFIFYSFVGVLLTTNLIANTARAEVYDLIKGKFPPETVKVVYDAPTTVILEGDLLVRATDLSTHPPNLDLVFNKDLWAANDLLKSMGFKFQGTITSGVGSMGNPTTVYVVLTK